MKMVTLFFSELLSVHANCTIAEIFPALPSSAALKLCLWKTYFISPVNMNLSQWYMSTSYLEDFPVGAGGN